ncbi:helix-turn-helix transcriptional regulator [Streptomyces sp. NBC_01224]|uniref:helix-turn-helix transcriptional regulator n=1 Tax=Streptomyces sp. NBC_01224 TaxID=2903783 RepID=UPI002E13F8EC|nr:helix-turn-helix transcriptional regulator [Streptomyces sp. NBC_01224]
MSRRVSDAGVRSFPVPLRRGTALSADGPRPSGVAPDAAEASLLTFLGLEPLEDAVYRLLVDRPDSEPAALADESTGCAEDVARALDVLVERGLASARPAGDAVLHYRASSPVLALGPLLEFRRAALRRVESLVTTLAERHRSAQAHASGAPVEVLSGAAAIRRRLLLMQDQATIEVCTMMPLREVHAVITVEDNHDEIEDVLMRRGVALRSVIERDWLERPEMAATAAAYAAQGQHISVVDELPIKLIIVDRRMALLPLAPERDDVDPVALAVHGTGLLTALSSLFEAHFERGWRLLPSGVDPGAGDTGGTGLDAVDRQIVSLLYVGLTDAAIARQLGMGHRTVQRRLQSLMVEVGAATRFQLGWHAACSGWLDETDAQSTPNRGENSAG